jgi:hypothetical protein
MGFLRNSEEKGDMQQNIWNSSKKFP